MTEKSFIRADEVAEELDVSKSYAYKVIKQLNDELSAKGYITVAGRISRQYFNERVYHICNCTSIDFVCFGFAQTHALPAQTGVQRIDYYGFQTHCFQKSENIATVVSRGFKSYFHFIRILFGGLDFEQ